MPKVMKVSTKGVVRRFVPYDGPPLPMRNAAYRGRITRATMSKSSGDNLMINLAVVFEALPGDPRAEFDGYVAFPRIVMGEHEMLQERLQGFLLAVCGKEEAEIKTSGDATRFQKGDKQTTPVETVGGKKVVGTVVNVYMQKQAAEGEYQERMDADQVFPVRDGSNVGGTKVDGAIDPGADEPEEEEDEGVEVVEEYTEADLKGKSIPALRKILVEEFDAATEEGAKEIKTKAKLVAAILEAQEEAEDEEVDDDEEIDDVEEDEEESADEEIEDDDVEEQIDEALEEMDRKALKAELSKRQPGRKFKVSESDDDLKAELKELMLEDPPF